MTKKRERARWWRRSLKRKKRGKEIWRRDEYITPSGSWAILQIIFLHLHMLFSGFYDFFVCKGVVYLEKSIETKEMGIVSSILTRQLQNILKHNKNEYQYTKTSWGIINCVHIEGSLWSAFSKFFKLKNIHFYYTCFMMLLVSTIQQNESAICLYVCMCVC